MDRDVRYTYNKNGSCRYYGKRLLQVDNISRDIFIVKEYYLARDTDGVLGFIGVGPKWFLNFATGAGSWAFNPIKEEKMVWSPYHDAYVLKSQTEHFVWPHIINERYEIRDGEKYTGYFYTDGPMVKLPEFKFLEKSKYV
jgi:hypothetical protein